MGEVKGWDHLVHPVSNWCPSFSFHINQTNHSWDISNSVWLWKNTIKIFKENLAKKISNRIPPKSNQVISKTRGDIATTFCDDWLSGSHFILQTSKFLFINATAMTLGQGHIKVIQYILPDLYLRCPQYLRCSSNGYDVRSKSHCGGGRRGRGDGNELKTLSHPSLGSLKRMAWRWAETLVEIRGTLADTRGTTKQGSR